MKRTIALIQMNVSIGEPEKNYLHALALMTKALKEAPIKPHMLVLPETINTGFAPSPDLKSIADLDGKRIKEICSAFAKDHQVYILAGSVTTLKKEKLYNTSYVFNKEGQLISEYDKIHTFSPFGEDKYYESGNQLALFDFDGILCGHMTCYDLRFPELARSLTLKGAEIIFVPAQWPLARIYAWETLTKARAIENQCYLCSVNACGLVHPKKPAIGQYGGHSMLVDPLGAPISQLSTHEEITYGEIDREALQAIREKMPLLADRRPCIYSL